MRDKVFYINSIKMDLYRVVTASGDISKPIAVDSVNAFLGHALKDFKKIEKNTLETELEAQLVDLYGQVNNLQDPHERLRWAENILTIRCRL